MYYSLFYKKIAAKKNKVVHHTPIKVFKIYLKEKNFTSKVIETFLKLSSR